MLDKILLAMLSKINPEIAQKIIFKQLKIINNSIFHNFFFQKLPDIPIQCMGLNFKNPVGLAAGLDKNAEFIDVFDAMGFGFIEVGTVTPIAQFGNLKPRIFHLRKVQGIINRMGFNNLGVDNLVQNIKKTKFSGVLGINVGKNKDTKIEDGKNDFILCIKKVYKYASYIVINISSPNTENLRRMQHGQLLDDLLFSIKNQQKKLVIKHNKYVPFLVKIEPDLDHNDIVNVADNLLHHKIDGIIATNTTIDRFLVNGVKNSQEHGGLSGRPLQWYSNRTIQILSKKLKGKIPIIGVGGINSLISAKEKIKCGASLIQLYSGLIYKGSRLLKDILNFF
ncbi:quinone-dependent dihydroorotate dehydrogenase [Candidatus Tachikawaea gelatinosa]|nr:quinone-dependent dihydroorotate dehydrogenase [Candidatus Tachikawaea gelatinosa]